MKTSRNIFPSKLSLLEEMGENFKLARKRRKLTAEQLSDRASISRKTLYLIEKGNPNVSLGAYFNVLQAMDLHQDIVKIASDDQFGRKLQDLDLL